MPWRTLRHSLFVCGLSLLIALGAALAGTFMHQDDAPNLTRAAASTPAREGESTSIGVLTKFAKQSSTAEQRALLPESLVAVSGTEAPAIATLSPTAEVSGETAGRANEAASETRVTSALTSGPAITEVPAEEPAPVVSASRFRARPTGSSTSSTGSQAASQPLQPGDRLTVPVTFYYCEDTTNGQRAGDGGGFCGAMRNGAVVHSGAAACDKAYLGQKFRIEGDPTDRMYVCADTGSGIQQQHRDIWFMSNGEGWAWQQVVGTSAVIQVLP